MMHVNKINTNVTEIWLKNNSCGHQFKVTIKKEQIKIKSDKIFSLQNTNNDTTEITSKIVGYANKYLYNDLTLSCFKYALT